ncbi:MAG: hypothetical protein HY901_37175 [Deltaproteobacteria bacterium]|nr:hypothetical protein [Deltaproteobacteria bacterium]
MAFPGEYRTLFLLVIGPTLLGLVAALGTVGFLQMESCVAVDRCLDQGGSFDYESSSCGFDDAGMPLDGPKSQEQVTHDDLRRIVQWSDSPGPAHEVAAVGGCFDAGDCCHARVLARETGCLVRWGSSVKHRSDIELSDGAEFVACSSLGEACGKRVQCSCAASSEPGDR